jgi:hypothetical protein
LGLFPAPRTPPNCGPHPAIANDPAHRPFRKPRRDRIPELIAAPLNMNRNQAFAIYKRLKKTFASFEINNPTKFTLLYQDIPLAKPLY